MEAWLVQVEVQGDDKVAKTLVFANSKPGPHEVYL